ncbi:RDD family protein [Streptomyces sp. NPDC052236]|uniref:RDD family protein n=1 Tax=Streptomyces sp. NPDC052236 TaxID=3365686 RepID=UPI0037D49093
MTNDQPPPGEPPEEDPFRKKPPPQEPTPPSGGDKLPPYDPSAYGAAPGGTDPLAGMPPLADFGRRFLARVIDGLIVFVPLAVLSLIFGGLDVTMDDGDGWDEITEQVNTGRQWLWSLISLLAYVGYDTFLTARQHGQTVGKQLMKIRVAMLNDGSVPDVSSSLLRAVVLWVPALLCCFCVWWLVIMVTILTDRPYKQGWHDKAGKTVVVSAAQ